MSALRQARPSEARANTRKPPARQETTPILDQYGRDPESLPEKLRAQTDYAKLSGYSPAYHAAVVDLTRLSSGAVCWAFCMVVNALSYGRPRGPKAPVNVWTLPISTADLAELCRANVKDIQRQLKDLADRGMIAVKQVKQGGTVRYSVSLLYSDWQALEDYAVWKRRQVVAIDEAGEDAEVEDEDPLPISKDAVHLTRKPVAVRPGRCSRPVKITVGAANLAFQNDSPHVDMVFNSVVQSGRLLVSVACKKGESEAKGEEKGNAERHGCRADQVNPLPDRRRSKGETARHPRESEIISLFDPLLEKWGSFPLLSIDPSSLKKACAELGDMPPEFLRHYVTKPHTGRGARSISSPLAVVGIVKDARLLWEKQEKLGRKVEAEDSPKLTEAATRSRRETVAMYRKVLADPQGWSDEDLSRAREQLAELEREQ